MQTRLGYILPLFKALGWDTSNINEVSPEEKISRGWVDFSFRIGNVPRFFLETKRVNEDLNDARWVKQAIDYAWTKSVTWALLSDLEGLRVFNAEWKESNPFSAQFFELSLLLVEKMLALQKERQSVQREDDLDRVLNLQKQIAQVDAEIDQRVYALYGLTEEEIKVVEGK
jgi:predicted type IV restriction endonuclease